MSDINNIILNGIAYDLDGGGGLTADLKAALDQLAQKVAYIDEDGQDYYDALHSALYPPADLVSISAVYTQSGTVYDTDTLNSLKSDLVVTAHMSDSTTQTVTTYTLSGTLTEGTSSITVAYGGKTTTFNVVVTHNDNSIYNWDFRRGIADSKQGLTAVLSGATQDSNGITWNAYTDYVYLCDLSDYLNGQFTVEIDVANLIARNGAMPVAFAPSTQLTNSIGLVNQHNSNRWFLLIPDNSRIYFEYDDSITSDMFSGKTLKFVHDAQTTNTWKVYADDVEVMSASITTLTKPYLGIYQLPAGSVITGVRIYNGVV